MAWQRKALISLVAICFGLLALGSLTQSGTWQADKRYFDAKCNEKSRADGDYKKDCQSFVFRAFDDPISVFTIVLAVATGALWLATRDLVKGADNTAKQQLRAYVGVDSVSLSFDEPTSSVTCRLRYENYGKTPANKISVQAYLAFVNDVPNPVIETSPVLGVDLRDLMPRQSSLSHPVFRFENYHNDRALLLAGEKVLCLIVDISYQDIFGDQITDAFAMVATGKRSFGPDPFLFVPRKELTPPA